MLHLLAQLMRFEKSNIDKTHVHLTGKFNFPLVLPPENPSHHRILNLKRLCLDAEADFLLVDLNEVRLGGWVGNHNKIKYSYLTSGGGHIQKNHILFAN